MDIGSKAAWPANVLSNFHSWKFIFRGIECGSMEGLLQSLKFDKPHMQVEVCKKVGFAAKKAGRNRNKAWQSAQTLWWMAEPMERQSIPYRDFLKEAFTQLYIQNPGFQDALKATGNQKLTHTIGNSDPTKTVLTAKEFCDILTELRNG